MAGQSTSEIPLSESEPESESESQPGDTNTKEKKEDEDDAPEEKADEAEEVKDSVYTEQDLTEEGEVLHDCT